MENEKGIPLANGGRDRKSESPDETASTGEKDPCLPVNNRATARAQGKFDDIDSKQKVTASSNSVNKNQTEAKFDRQPKFGAGFEEVLKRKTGLSHCGLIVAGVLLSLLFIFLIVIIVLATTWPRTPHSQLFPVCTRAACLEASALILPKMNTSAPPCEDFWTYSCGHWLKSHSRPPSRSRWNLDEERAFKYREKLRTLVTTLPFPTDTRSIIWKLQHLYGSCMHLDNVESDGERPLRRLISQFGGWSVLRDFTHYAWDVKSVLVKLHAEHNVSPFFHISVVPDPQDPSKSIVQISPSGLDLPNKSYYYRPPDSEVPKAYMNYLKDVVQQLGAVTTDAAAFSKNLFYFQQRIAEITPDPEELLDPIANSKRVTIANLRLTASSIPLLDILQAMFAQVAFHDSTEVLVTSSMYLTNISNIISDSDRSSLNNYMMWIFTSSYLPYLSKQYREVQNVYQHTLTGVEQPIQRWEMCIATLQKYMSFALAALSTEEIRITEKELNKKQVGVMFDSIQSAVRNRLAKASWFVKDLQGYALQKVNSMSLQVGFTSHMLSETYLDNYYSTLQIQKNDLFQNIRNAVEFQLSKQRAWLINPSEEYKWIDAMSGNTVSYIPLANKVVVPQQLLVSPYFHSQYPKSLLYGGLGVQIASAVVSSVLPWNIMYDGEGMILADNRTEINQTVKSVNKAKEFVILDVVASGKASLAVAKRTALSTVTHIAAVRQAHAALTEALSGLPHVHQPGMEHFESDQLFFLTYAQNLCSQATLQQIDLDATFGQQLNSSLLLPTTLKQLIEFSNAFSCPTNSQLYAANTCTTIL